MGSFITNISMGKESDVYRVGGKSYSSDAVRLSTVHGAKGLEFPVVFIFGAEEGKFPARPSAASGDENAEPEEKDPSDRDLEEERRIFFVAMTRAKELLYINTVSGKESEFISELPGELCHEEEARAYTKSDREKRSAREQGVQMSIFDFI